MRNEAEVVVQSHPSPESIVRGEQSQFYHLNTHDDLECVGCTRPHFFGQALNKVLTFSNRMSHYVFQNRSLNRLWCTAWLKSTGTPAIPWMFHTHFSIRTIGAKMSVSVLILMAFVWAQSQLLAITCQTGNIAWYDSRTESLSKFTWLLMSN